MLTRTFRLTDKLSNALLRTAAWGGTALLAGTYYLRVALIELIITLWFTLTRTARTGQGIYRTTEQHRRDLMARRVSDSEARPAVREDPIKTQIRALSMFTVGLLGSLIVLVLWFTSAQGASSGGAPRPGVLPPVAAQGTPTRSSGLPTLPPTLTQIPDPLRVGGSIVYSLHDRGYDNLWAIGIGQSSAIRLTNGAYDDRDPVWSHDGKRIAFASHRDGYWSLYILEIAGGKITRLTYPPGYERAPSWSPDDQYIVYEGYDGINLDIYFVSSDGKQIPKRLTQNPAPDFAPSWSPGGRDIAFVSLRDGAPAIYDLNLDHPGNPTLDSTAARITPTPNIDQDTPTWSPDGKLIAYTGRDSSGLRLVYVKTLAQANADPVVVGQGRAPSWSPDSLSLLSAVDRNGTTTFIASPVGSVGVAYTTVPLSSLADHPSWTVMPLPPLLVQNPPQATPVVPPLYNSTVGFSQPNPPYYRLANVLPDVPNGLLTEKVADSFVRLREAVRAQTGLDYLGGTVDLWWAIQGSDRHVPDPGQSPQNWHFAGRSFDIDRNLIYSNSADVPPSIEVVREDDPSGSTFWRVYLRVAANLQGGSLGEPLRRRPWDFASRTSQDPQAFENGGRPKGTIPNGYYVDLTALAADYGWARIPADRAWRALASGLLYWEFDRRDGLAWNDAMLEIYAQNDITNFLSGPTPIPTPFSPPTQPGPTRTPTPIPPDQLKP